MTDGSEISPTSERRTRASTAEREAVVDRLNTACGDGRITLDEFSDRVEKTYAAQWRDQLDPLLVDLPAVDAAPDQSLSTTHDAAPVPVPAADAAARTRWHISPLGGMRRRGYWRVPAKSVSVEIIGGASLDLTDAELAAPVVELTHVSVIGGVDIRVPPGINVEVSGLSLLGGVSEDTGRHVSPGAPTVRLRVFSLIGGVSVHS